jgi:hypothetical protein
MKQTTDRLTITQNRVEQVTSKSYVELDRSKTTTPETSSQQAKQTVVQVTDRGITGLSKKEPSPELTTEGNPVDDYDGFQEPPSEEQFKDEDLFYLHDTSTESGPNDDITFTVSQVQHNTDRSVFGDDFKSESGETDTIEELGLSEPHTDIEFKDEDLRGRYENSETRDYVQPTESMYIPDVFKSTTNFSAPREYASNATPPDVSSSFSTKSPHRFRTPTTTLTPIMPKSRTEQSMVSSTQEPPEEKVFITKNTSKPHTMISHMDDEDHATDSRKTLLRNDDISTRRSMRFRSTSTPASSSTVPTSVSSTTEEPVTKKLKPIFVEIIHRGSSESPLLKTYTVEELEKGMGTTESLLSTEKDSLTSGYPETVTSRSQTMKTSEIATTLTVSPSPVSVTLSRRVRPRKKFTSLTPVPDITPTKFTTSIPPTTLSVTLSRKVEPPVLIPTSSDTHGKNKIKSGDVLPESSTIRTRARFQSTEHTTPISPVTLSRRVQPPLVNSSGLSTPTSVSSVGRGRQPNMISTANREASVSFQTIATDRFQNTGIHQLPQEAYFGQDILESTESSASTIRNSSDPTKNSTVYVEIQHQTSSEPSPITTLRQQFISRKQKTVTESVESTTPFLNTAFEMDLLTGEPPADADIPMLLPLKQEPTSSPHYGSRDGLAIPASLGPSTLHSLAVYFATKNSNQETTVDTLTGFDSKKHKGKEEKPAIEGLSVTSSRVQNDTVTEVNETNVHIVAPSFLTKSIRDSYSVLFPNTKEEHSSTTEESVRHTTRTAEISSAKFKTKDRKTIHSSDIVRSELLEKLADMSKMEAKPSNEERIPSSERETLRSDAEDLLQGTDSRDLRELAQIFSQALSAYLEDPEEFKKVLTEVRPRAPSSVYTNDVKQKQLDSNQFQDTTISSVSSSTSIPLTTPNAENFPFTQEDEEVLDFSDVPKVPRRNSKLSNLMSPHSKSIKMQKWKNPVTTSYVISAVDTSSKRNVVTETASKSSSTEAMEEVDLKPPEEGLQNAQSAYYTLSKGQVLPNTASVSPEVFENLQVAKGLGEDYTLPPGTMQYQGPGYGPQPGEANFAPTAGGVNDPSRPRYGGFQNNSGVPPEEASVKAVDIQGVVEATTFVPGVRYQTRSTIKPISTTPDVETTSAKEGATETVNIFNTFVPQEVNNLANVGGRPKTPPALLSDKNVQQDCVRPHNLISTSDEALLGSNMASSTSSQVHHPSNPVNVERKWSSLGNVVDALTINHKLSESSVGDSTSSTAMQEFIPSVVTTQKSTSITNSMFKIRHRSTSKPDISEPTVAVLDGENPTTTVPNSPDKFSTGGTSKNSPQTQGNRHFQLRFEAESENSHEGSKGNSSPEEELQPQEIPGVIFYSEMIKPLPPPSASLIRVSVSKKNNTEINSSTRKYISEKVSAANNNPEEISIITSTANISFTNQPVSTTQTYSPPMELKFTSSPHKSGTEDHSFPRQQSSKITPEPNLLGQELKNGTLRGDPEMSPSLLQFMPASVTQTTLSETSPTIDITIASWKQESKQFEEEISDVDLQHVQTSTGVPLSASILPSTRANPTGRSKNPTKYLPSYNEEVDPEIEEDHFVVPNTSMSTLAFLARSRSVTVSPNSNISSRVIKSQKQKSLNRKVTSAELKDVSNSQQSVTISTVAPSTKNYILPNTSNIATFTKIFSFNCSLTSVPRTSLETGLRMDNLTMEQLQTLEDLQTLLFSANSTMAENGTMFSNLNQSSTLSLISTMKQAVTNSTFRRLVLLLVNTLKESSPDEARSQIIEALLRIPIDHKPLDSQQDSMSTLQQQKVESSEKSNGKGIPVSLPGNKSYVRPFFEMPSQSSMNKESDSDSKHLTMVQAPAIKFHSRDRKTPQAATPQAHPIAMTVQRKGRRPVRLRTTTESPGTESRMASSQEENPGPEDLAEEGDTLPQSDTRAIELLRSLYSLASRWG